MRKTRQEMRGIGWCIIGGTYNDIRHVCFGLTLLRSKLVTICYYSILLTVITVASYTFLKEIHIGERTRQDYEKKSPTLAILSIITH